jgi:cephalosporin-C deacetylase-like acetyl esterase
MNHNTNFPIELNVESFFGAPITHPASEHQRPNVESFFFENEPYHGNPTRVFGWMGVPPLKMGETCPAMVLIHGGGGTAFDDWVRLWNDRGYAAIAIDTTGCMADLPIPIKCGEHPRHDHSGPVGWCESFKQMKEKRTDQWPYHAITALLRAHSLIATQPGVDPQRIGVTGISWGGYLTSLMMGIDHRYAAAIPVYGCGYLTGNSVWRDQGYHGVSQSEVEDWGKYWDPQHYLPNAQMPSLWVNGTNDFAFPLDSFQKSYQHPQGSTDLLIIHEMGHSHEHGWNPPEIAAFTDALFFKKTFLPTIDKCEVIDGHLIATVRSDVTITKADIVYTRGSGMWQDRRFNTLENIVTISGNTVSAPLPLFTTVAYLQITDERGMRVSTPHFEV